ncbi:hypothetical protein C8R44DRAFT_753867 [Mycena epipterygia]|nr:hypothetical protein C8R44DRAFT_753867 [Mycena epipterygia]
MWQKWLPDLGVDKTTLPPWGPSAVQLATCMLNAHLPARGEDRHYDAHLPARGEDRYYDESEDEGGDGDDDETETGGKDEDFGMLDAVETADIARQTREGNTFDMSHGLLTAFDRRRCGRLECGAGARPSARFRVPRFRRNSPHQVWGLFVSAPICLLLLTTMSKWLER